MCLAAYQPAGTPAMPKEHFENAWEANHDGAGYMFASKGELFIRKPFYDLESLRTQYEKDHAEYGAESAFVVHFRFATHGNKLAGNVHPHELCDGKAGLVHNGILKDFDPAWGSDMSDTAWFCNTVLAMRPVEQMTDEKFCDALGNLIGLGNKFIIMDANGSVAIVNQESGQWDGENWYSNSSHETPIKRVYYSPKQSAGAVAESRLFDPKAKVGSDGPTEKPLSKKQRKRIAKMLRAVERKEFYASRGVSVLPRRYRDDASGIRAIDGIEVEEDFQSSVERVGTISASELGLGNGFHEFDPMGERPDEWDEKIEWARHDAEVDAQCEKWLKTVDVEKFTPEQNHVYQTLHNRYADQMEVESAREMVAAMARDGD